MRYSRLRIVVLGLAVAACALGAAAPSRADNDDWRRGPGREKWERDRVRHEREWRDEGRREHGYVYAPPPVYYAPPPVAPALNFVFPLTIR